jgi:hypothetical protein
MCNLRFLRNFVLLTIVLSSFILIAQQGQPDLTGHWHLESKRILGVQQYDLDLKQTGATITGTAKYQRSESKLEGPYSVEGTASSSKITLTIKGELRVIGNGTDKRVDVVYKGKQVDQNTLEGTVDVPVVGVGTWTAKRK